MRDVAECVIVYTDGSEVIVDVGKPRDLVWFGDTFGKLEATSYGEFARLVHHVAAPGEPFLEWIDRVDELNSQDEALVEAHARIAKRNGHPPQPAEDTDEPAAAGAMVTGAPS